MSLLECTRRILDLKEQISGRTVRAQEASTLSVLATIKMARGKVTYAKSSGRLHAFGQLTIWLASMQLADGKTLPGRACHSRRDCNHFHYDGERCGETKLEERLRRNVREMVGFSWCGLKL